MSILQISEVASFLGMDSAAEGFQDAVDQAESLTAGELGMATLDLVEHVNETKVFSYTTQQILTKYGPIQELTAFTYGDEDELANVSVAGDWSIRWTDPRPVRDFDRVRSFERMSRAIYTYKSGWTNAGGLYPLPTQVATYIKAFTGLVYRNLLASGIYDTKLGDMTIKMQRETLDKSLATYRKALHFHARPF